MDTLTVVNEMLGTMGEVGLASLTDYHPFRDDALGTLDRINRTTQARPLWFNQETTTLTPNVVDSFIYLPNDLLEVDVKGYPNYVQRGGRLYNTTDGTYVFTAPVKLSLRRLVNFEDLPESAAAYVAAEAVLQFQSNYDGDSSKRQEKAGFRDTTFALFQAEDTRKRQGNLLDNNPRLWRIKRATVRLRGWTG